MLGAVPGTAVGAWEEIPHVVLLCPCVRPSQLLIRARAYMYVTQVLSCSAQLTKAQRQKHQVRRLARGGLRHSAATHTQPGRGRAGWGQTDTGTDSCTSSARMYHGTRTYKLFSHIYNAFGDAQTMHFIFKHSPAVL